MIRGARTKRNLKAVILAGYRDFGRCPLASRLPVGLWPVGPAPVVLRLLTHLWRQGIKQAFICAGGDASLLREYLTGKTPMRLIFPDEPLPAGTAGCIRDVLKTDTNSLLLVFRAATALPPNLDILIRAHRAGRSLLTVMFEPDGAGQFSSEIYICEPGILRYIPARGYYDIKEGLIPTMLQAGKAAHSGFLPQNLGNFRDRDGYLAAVSNYLVRAGAVNADFPSSRRSSSKNIWISPSARLSPDVRIYEPVLISERAVIAEGVTIVGPAVIGRGAFVGDNSLLEETVLWDGSKVGGNCRLKNCVIDYDTTAADNSIICDRAVARKKQGVIKTASQKALTNLSQQTAPLRRAVEPVIEKVSRVMPASVKTKNLNKNLLPLMAAAVLGFVFLWSYWPGLTDLWNIWTVSDEYSSGMLVPLLAGYVLWSRRKKIASYRIRPSIWGLAGLLFAQALRYFGLFFMYASAERLSLVLSIASLTLFLFGWQFFRGVSMVLVFLCLMLPLPRSIHSAVMLPLQELATTSAVFLLEMIGYSVIRQGNIIHLSGATVAVAEACNGLRMVTSFFVVIMLVLLLIRRSWWEKLIVFISALPIALLCNSIRLTITSVAFTMIPAERWEKVFHDFGGYGMMPLALGAVILELWLLKVMTSGPRQSRKLLIIASHKK